ncbi:MAG: QueT transporter family protein [Candidatus Aphodomorpha sp.]|nr:QueT transporter family protein [bacterium]
MNTRSITRAAIIAALYILLSLAVQPIASGLVQCRISEALTILPVFTGAAVPGLFIGCLLFNLISGAVAYDVVFGSLATLLAALLTWRMAKRGMPKWLLPLPSVVFNGLIVGALLVYAYGVPVSYPLAVLYVAAGQAVACYVLGMPLMLLLGRFGKKLFS